MNLQKLLDGPTKVSTKIGPLTKLTRLAPPYVDREFRSVEIEFSPVRVTRSFLYPWRRDQVLDSWDIRATIRRKNGPPITVNRLVRLDRDASIEMMMLDVVKQAVLQKAQQLEARIAV